MGAKKSETRKSKQLTQESIQKKAICPHCEQEIVNVQWRGFADDKIILMACGNCFKVIGTSYHF